MTIDAELRPPSRLASKRTKTLLVIVWSAMTWDCAGDRPQFPPRANDAGGERRTGGGSSTEVVDASASGTDGLIDGALLGGAACSRGEQCEGGQCVDGVCCDSRCDQPCARCDVPESVGTCTQVLHDPVCGELKCPPDTECRKYEEGVELQNNCASIGTCMAAPTCTAVELPDGVECQDGAGACDGLGQCIVLGKKPLGDECTRATECESGHCSTSPESESGVCCEVACDGLCRACTADGHCTATPADDLRCPTVTCPEDTACINYAPPLTSNRCVAQGQCAQQGTRCTPSYVPATTTCGTNLECDGNGTCVCLNTGPALCPTTTNCGLDTIACLPCTELGDCAHLVDTPACNLDSGECVECTAEEAERCGSTTCSTVPGPGQFTCSNQYVDSALACQSCVGDAACPNGHGCVPETFDGIETGWYCLPQQAEDGDCTTQRPYVGRVNLRSVDGLPGPYCRPRHTTCTGYLNYGRGSNLEEGTSCATHEDCGLPGVDDGLCLPSADLNDDNRCTYVCVVPEDCRTASTCGPAPIGTDVGGNDICSF